MTASIFTGYKIDTSIRKIYCHNIGYAEKTIHGL